MWKLVKLFTVFALVLNGEARPKKYHGLEYKSKAPRADVGRLSENVIPSAYTIDLTLTEDDLTNAVFSGIVKIDFNITGEIKTFPIHAKFLTIATEKVRLSHRAEGDLDADINTAENENDFWTITYKGDGNIAEGDYSLEIPYTGILSETDMDGFYKSSYKDADGNDKYLAVTQFESMGARRAFPSFDEPALKAVFTVTITHPKTMTAYSNMAGTPAEETDELTKTTFPTTPIMSTYLVAFLVSELYCKEDPDSINVPTALCARPEANNTMNLAFVTAPKALTAMKDYTQVDYKDMNVGKMTQAAIPDFAAGAMENWGMTTYREADLLVDETESSNAYRQTVVTVIAHEFSHQWFGDLVTLDWWSDTFLNEGFATYFEYYAAAQMEGSQTWDLPKQFVLEQLQPVLLTDSSEDSLALSLPSDDPNALSRFDDISYNKGGTILRMVHYLLLLDNFKHGLTGYLTTYKNNIGTPTHLWESLDKYKPAGLPKTLPEIMNSWTTKPGYPVLTVTLAEDGKSVNISQKRFLLPNKDEDSDFYVPITYTTSKDTTTFLSTKTQQWLQPSDPLKIDNLDLGDSDWILLNNQQIGYYRVNYDNTLLTRISDVLNSEKYSDIDEISRSQLVDDQLNFARSGLKTYEEVLKFLTFLKRDDSYYSWYSAFNGFSYLLKRTNDPKVKAALNTFIEDQMEALSDSIKEEKPDDQVYTLKQVLARTWACKIGNGDCVKLVKDQLRNYVDNGTTPQANLKSVVYCYGLQNSDTPADDFAFLWDKYVRSDLATERITLLKALGCVSDTASRKTYLKTALTSDVRLQDYTYVFSSVYSNNPEGIDDVLDFISSNYSDFEPHFGSTDPLLSLISNVADQFTSQEHIDKLNKFATGDVSDEIKGAVTRAVAKANTNLETVESLESTLKDYFKLNSAVVNSFQFMNLALVLLVYAFYNLY